MLSPAGLRLDKPSMATYRRRLAALASSVSVAATGLSASDAGEAR